LLSKHLIFLAGATIGYFPVDQKSLEYLRQTNRDEDKIQLIEAYLTAVGMLRYLWTILLAEPHLFYTFLWTILKFV
jgi:hypothetical protein